MKSLIRKCIKCSSYTMNEKCGLCGSETVMALPQKYSPTDRFQKYRIMEKS